MADIGSTGGSRFFQLSEACAAELWVLRASPTVGIKLRPSWRRVAVEVSLLRPPQEAVMIRIAPAFLPSAIKEEARRALLGPNAES